ncbi:MAG: 3-oxoacid CoA-transferase subunit A [Rhodospirillaceae bacterium]|nr:3-oxoacid CoA-transferase subunit A [Rhodospirillaceae bacterium]
MNKVRQLDDVIEDLKDGATIMLGGFLSVGTPLKCIEKIVKKGVKDLTLISVVNTYPGKYDLYETGGFDLAPLFANNQIRKMITAHTGTCAEAVQAMKEGKLEIEFFPMGSWIEKIRAGGAGLGGVLTPTGIGTLMEEGKKVLEINGKRYLLELPLRAEFAFINGYRADPLGNIEYRGIGLNTNPTIAMAADYTVAEVNEIVGVGDIDPLRVGTPSVFVKAVVQGYTLAERQDVFRDMWVKTGRIKVPAAAE